MGAHIEHLPSIMITAPSITSVESRTQPTTASAVMVGKLTSVTSRSVTLDMQFRETRSQLVIMTAEKHVWCSTRVPSVGREQGHVADCSSRHGALEDDGRGRVAEASLHQDGRLVQPPELGGSVSRTLYMPCPPTRLKFNRLPAREQGHSWWLLEWPPGGQGSEGSTREAGRPGARRHHGWRDHSRELLLPLP